MKKLLSIILSIFIVLSLPGCKNENKPSKKIYQSKSTENEDIKDVANTEVEIVVNSGIQISLDASSWKNSVTTDEIRKVAIFPDDKYTMEPISTNAKTNANGRLDFYSAQINADGITLTSASIPAPGESNGKLIPKAAAYITFDLYVKVDTASELYLHDDSKVTNPDSSQNLFARVAFVDQGYVAIDAAPGDAIKLASSGTTAVVWEPNATIHAAEAIQLGTSVEGGASANPYKGISGIANDIPNNPNGTHSKLESVYTIDTIGVHDNAIITKLEPGINKISISIWLEGQDGDCVNTISGNILNASLKFAKTDIA